MLTCKYGGVFEAVVNMVMAGKGGCSFAAGIRESKNAAPKTIDTLSLVNECEDDPSGQVRRG